MFKLWGEKIILGLVLQAAFAILAFVMLKLKRNTFLIFATAVLALFACLNAYSLDYTNDLMQNASNEQAFDNPYGNLPAPVFRPHHNVPVQGTHERESGLLGFNEFKSYFKTLVFQNKYSGYPSSLFFRVSKDYYVFTLEKILC